MRCLCIRTLVVGGLRVSDALQDKNVCVFRLLFVIDGSLAAEDAHELYFASVPISY